MKVGEVLGGLGRPVAYFPALARFLGSTDAAVMLAQFIYWRGRTKHAYLFTTRTELEDETGIGIKAQRRACKILTDFGVKVTYARLEHKLHVLLDTKVLDQKWTTWMRKGGGRVVRREGLKRDVEGRFCKDDDPAKSVIPRQKTGESMCRKRHVATGRKRHVATLRERPVVSLDFSQTSPLNPPFCSPYGGRAAPREICAVASSRSRGGENATKELEL